MSDTISPRKVAEAYWVAECAHDIPAIMQLYVPDAVFSVPGKRLVGHAQIRTFYEESFRRFVGLEVEIVHEISRGDEAALEWKAVFTDAGGQRFPLDGLNLIKVRGGQIVEMRCYFDPKLLLG